jgi:transcriptional regulator with XRE-family HTH domain
VDTKGLGREIRWARRRAGLTQDELAQMLGMPQSTIARVEMGTVSPLATTLMSILEATGHRIALEPMREVREPAVLRRWQAMPIPRRTRTALGRAVNDRSSDPVLLLRRLRGAGVPFVLVGRLAEGVHGVPTKVRQIEICHSQTIVALERLGRALAEIGPASTQPARLRLMTQTAAGDDYDTLLRNATRMPVVAGLQVRVASVHDLIRNRVARGRQADLQSAAILRAIANGG